MKRHCICPLCGQSAEIASISHFLYAHHCPVGGWWYSNGILWSQSRDEVTPVERVVSGNGHEPATPNAGA